MKNYFYKKYFIMYNDNKNIFNIKKINIFEFYIKL